MVRDCGDQKSSSLVQDSQGTLRYPNYAAAFRAEIEKDWPVEECPVDFCELDEELQLQIPPEMKKELRRGWLFWFLVCQIEKDRAKPKVKPAPKPAVAAPAFEDTLRDVTTIEIPWVEQEVSHFRLKPIGKSRYGSQCFSQMHIESIHNIAAKLTLHCFFDEKYQG